MLKRLSNAQTSDQLYLKKKKQVFLGTTGAFPLALCSTRLGSVQFLGFPGAILVPTLKCCANRGQATDWKREDDTGCFMNATFFQKNLENARRFSKTEWSAVQRPSGLQADGHQRTWKRCRERSRKKSKKWFHGLRHQSCLALSWYSAVVENDGSRIAV